MGRKKTRRDLLLEENLKDFIYVYYSCKKHKVYKARSMGGIEEGWIFFNQLQFYTIFTLSSYVLIGCIRSGFSQIYLYNTAGILGIITFDILILLFPLLLIYEIVCTLHLFKARKLILNNQRQVTYSKNDVDKFSLNTSKIFNFNRSLNLFIVNDKFVYANRNVCLGETDRQKFKRRSIAKTILSFVLVVYFQYLMYF